MKLNAAAEMLAPSAVRIHGHAPLVPEDQAEGYRELIQQPQRGTESDNRICRRKPATPIPALPGEYAGLRVIRAYQESIGQGHRNKVLIPASAHGTNPASAVQVVSPPLPAPATNRATLTWPTSAPKPALKRTRTALPR